MNNLQLQINELKPLVEKARIIAWNRKSTIKGDFAKYKRREVQIKYRQLRNQLKKLERLAKSATATTNA